MGGSAVFHTHNTNINNSLSYLTSGFKDILFSVAIGLFGFFFPKYIILPSVGVNWRPIPYQQTKAGDVLLDLTLSNDYVENVKFTSFQLIQAGVFLPILVILLLCTFHKGVIRSHAGLCCAAFAIGISEFSTNLIKFYVGRLRPNFYSMCGFDVNTLECTGSQKHQIEARLSFPSGHSSMSFCGMGVLMWFLLGCWLNHCRESDKNRGGNPLAKINVKVGVMLTILPMSFAAWISTSRLVDNWHHPSDVIAGSIIGFVCATISYHLWFYPVFSDMAGYPLIHNSTREDKESSPLV